MQHTTAMTGAKLSGQQSRIWSMQQRSQPYRIQAVLLVEGAFDLQRFLQGVHECVARHEILRTRFRTLPGMQVPLQIVETTPDISYETTSLENVSPDEQNSQLAHHIAAHLHAPSDLSQDPPLRLHLIDLAPQHMVVSMTLPALCADPHTLYLLLAEISAFYNAKSTADEEDPLQYIDISAWTNDLLQAPEAAPHLDFWQKIDLNAANQTPIPFTTTTDNHEVPPLPHDGRECIQLPTDLSTQVNHLIEQWQVSEELFWLTCWSLLIARLTNTPTHHIGLLANGRGYEELQAALGPYSRVLPLPVEIQTHETIQQTLQHLLPSYQRALDEQDYWVWPSTTASQADLTLPLGFAFLDWSQSLQFGDAAMTLHDLVNSYEPTAMHLEVVRTPRGHQLTFTTDPTRLSATARTHLSQCLLTLLQQIVNQPELPINAYHLVNSDEQQRLLTLLQGPELSLSEATLSQRFEEQVRLHPHAPALRYDETMLSYTQLNRRANQLARGLWELGVGANIPVALCLPRGIEMIVGLLAILKAGGAYVPMDPEHPIERLAYQIEQLQAPLLLISERDRERLSPLHPHTVCIEDLQVHVDCYEDTNLPALQGPEDLLYIIYTSGSTGKPKGVLVYQRNAINYVSALLPRLAPQAGLQIATVSTLAADLGNTAIFCALLSGGCLHVLDYTTVTSGAAFAAYTLCHPLDMLKIVPSHLQALLSTQEDATILPRRTLVLGGEALPIKLLARLSELGATCEVWNHYGPTETTIGSLVAPLGVLDQPTVQHWQAQGAIPIGRPLANTHLYVLDPCGHLIPPGIAGELYIGGAGVTAGYLHQPEQSERRFVPDPFRHSTYEKLYRTGDLVRMNDEGQLVFIGRIDQQIKIRGHRIELGEIEAVLGSYHGIWRCVVIGRQDEEETRLVGYIVARQQPAPTAQELRAHLQQFLPEVMIPSAFVVLPKLPLNANGKIDHAQLPAPTHDQQRTSASYVAPRTHVEEILVGIWQDLLKVPQIGVNDDFTALGGHSLLATQIISRLRLAFQVEIPLRNLFEFPTVAGLARCVETALHTEQNIIIPPLVAISQQTPLPVSFAQQRLWFLHQLNPGNTTYNKAIAIQLKGDLNEQALETSLSEIVRRHESLRTTFTLYEGEPVQIIHLFEAFTLHHLHLTHSDETSHEEQLAHLLSLETTHPFDLEQGPLFRATLIHLNYQDYALVLSMHHIVSDGWSNAVLLREVTQLYQAAIDGLPSPLPTLPVQYADFSHWQREWLQGSLLDSQVQYWQQQLAGVPPLLLPTDAPRPPRLTFAGAHIGRSLPPELVSALKTLSQQEGVTFFMTLLATFQLLLARLSGQHDLAVGTPIANRTRSELEGLIGFFVNTLVLRTDLSGQPSFRTLLQRVREVALGAYAHQDVPFEKLVQLLQPERDLSRSPFFQALFVLQQAPLAPDALPGLSVNLLATEEASAKFDLTLALTELPQGMHVTLEYNTDLFSTERMQRLLDTWHLLLQAVLSNPEQAVWSLPLLSAPDQERLHAWNATQQPYPLQHGLPQRISEQAALTPDRIALVFEEQSLSYDALERRSNQLAHALHAHGVGPEHLVGVCLPRSLELVIALVAILKAGAAYVPLDPSYPAERLQMMARDADLSVLLSNQQAPIAMQLGVSLTLDLDDWHPFASFPEQAPATFNDPELLAYMIYTSGSTGTPKGALNSQRGICNRLLWMQEMYQLQADDRVLQKTPMSFDVSVWEFFWPLLTGACLVLARPEGHRDTRYLRDLLSQEAITTLHFVPSMLHLFVEEDALERCDSVRRILCSGEALPLPLQQRTYERLPWIELHNLYGPTEAAVDVTFWHCPQEETGRAVPIGRPIANTQIHLLDPLGQPVPIGAIGELYIGGINVGRGYWRRAALTAERFVPDPWSHEPGARLYRTGDLACYREDGVIDYLGRIDSQIKIRGQRIELGEVEAILARQPAVQECAVIVHERVIGEQVLVGFVVAQQGSHLESAELRRLLREQVPEAMVPAFIQVLPALPLLPNGKIDRKALTMLEYRQTQKTLVQPRNTVEYQLQCIWQEILNIQPISVTDSFFELGGHSLLAIRLLSKIREQFASDLPLSILFQHSTIADLASVVSQETQTTDWSTLVALQSKGSKPPFFCIHPAGGTLFRYHELAQLLGPERPFYGLQTSDRDDEQAVPPTVEQIAATYIAELCTIQPHGPYYLGGWSLGGVIAFEMAQQLTQRGENVGLLALFDSQLPPSCTGDKATVAYDVSDSYLARIALQHFDISIPEDFGTLEPKQQLKQALTLAKAQQAVPEDTDLVQFRRGVRINSTNLHAVKTYVPHVYNGKITLFRATGMPDQVIQARDAVKASPTRGWETLTTQEVKVHLIPGLHSEMVDRPNVEVLARLLGGALD